MNLHLSSGKTQLHILRDINFEIKAGEVVAVVGPSGSGKTSLLMVLAGLEKATDGEVQTLGTSLGALNEDELARVRRQHLGILFQNFHLIPSMTALENVSLTLEFVSDDAPVLDIERRATDALVDVGLGERLHHLPNALSGGEQQRVGLARAVVGRPGLLLADEPTGNLDQETAAAAIDLLFGYARKQHTAVVLITHDAGLAAKADRLMRMDHGRLRDVAAVQS